MKIQINAVFPQQTKKNVVCVLLDSRTITTLIYPWCYSTKEKQYVKLHICKKKKSQPTKSAMSISPVTKIQISQKLNLIVLKKEKWLLTIWLQLFFFV